VPGAERGQARDAAARTAREPNGATMSPVHILGDRGEVADPLAPYAEVPSPEAFEELVRAAGMPTRLHDIGIPAADLESIAVQTATLAMMQNAPRAVEAAEIRSWLEAVW